MSLTRSSPGRAVCTQLVYTEPLPKPLTFCVRLCPRSSHPPLSLPTPRRMVSSRGRSAFLAGHGVSEAIPRTPTVRKSRARVHRILTVRSDRGLWSSCAQCYRPARSSCSHRQAVNEVTNRVQAYGPQALRVDALLGRPMFPRVPIGRRILGDHLDSADDLPLHLLPPPRVPPSLVL